VLKGLDYEEATLSILLALALVARRHDFEGRGDPSVRVSLAGRAVLFAAVIVVYGAIALWINRVSIDQPFGLRFALRETGEAAVGMHLSGSEHIRGSFGEWFPVSVFVLTVSALLALLWSWLAPWRFRLGHSGEERRRAQELVHAFGTDTLAPFALRADKSYFFSEDEQAFLAYKVTAGVAVISGDPIGPEHEVRALLERFRAYVAERDWRIAVLGAGERYLPVYRELGLRALYHGDEAVIDTASFSLEGRAIRKVRQSVGRLEREGYRAELRYAGDIHDELRAELEDVARIWRGDAPEKGFTMELDTLFRLDGREAVFALGFAPDGAVAGFQHFAVVWPGKALSLSSMPRKRDSPNGLNEWLVVETIRWARANGLERISLNFAPFAAVLAPEEEAEGAGWRQLQRGVLGRLKGHGFQLENLLAFNRKFFPHWERRFIVYEGPLDLPRVGVAGLAAEGYLPLPGARR
jgi:lysyl-tRNA synthetase class 2